MGRLNFRVTASAWTEALLDGLLPRHCVMCGLSSGSENLCRPCAAELPRIGHCCLQCGLPLLNSADRICGHCLAKAPPWTSAIAALEYCFPIDQLVCRFKFGRNLACGEILSRELILAAEEKCKELPTCILPVPLHRSRHFSRAFNQADLLARQAGKALGIPVYSSVLRRRRRTRAHSGLAAAQRKINIRGAFACRIPSRKHAQFEHVALIDDVMTTGATLTECTQSLKKAGTRRVSIWVAARALEPS